MPVQKKSNQTGPGEKPKKNWIQIGTVAFILLVVIMCIFSFCNFSNLFNQDQYGTSGMNTPIAEGDAAAIYFTTSIGNQTLFSYLPTNSSTSMTPYRIIANSSSNIKDNDYESIKINLGNQTIPYGVHAIEQNAIARALVNKSYNQPFSVNLSYNVSVSCTANDIKTLGMDIKDLKVGEVLPMMLGYTDILGKNQSYLKNGIITSIKPDLSGITMNCGCEKIDVVAVGKYSS